VLRQDVKRTVLDNHIALRVVLAFGLAVLCLLSSACGSGSSSGNEPNTGTMPSIATQPTNQTVNVGQTATFSVTASGTAPLSYQWQKGGVAISGATSASYTTPAVQASDDGTTFTVTVTNAAGSVSSSAATLTVTAVPPPTALSCAGYPKTGQNFAQACVILQESAQVTPSLTVTTLAGNLTGHGQDNLQSFVVYARVIAQDANEGAATALANSVVINTANGNVSAMPDQATAPQGLSIDFEVFTAQTTNLTLTADNAGNLAVDNYNAILNLTTAAGNADLSAVQGQETVNVNAGNIDVTFTGTSFTGAGMTAKTKTGNVTASRPVGFQAAFTAETNVGIASIDGQKQIAPVPNSPAVVTSGTGAPILLQTNTGNASVTN
jgi:hypothetical protein